jgi:DNA-binding transcriptional LysR family regulator
VSADEVVPMRGATLKQLRAFSLVARQLSFVQAAAALHLTPSAVSLQIKELESALGLALFVRQGKTVALTAAGQALLSDVHRALAALKDADDTLVRLRGMERPRVCIGMVSNAKYFVPRLMADFHRARRDIELRITVGNREQLLDQLRRGEIEFAVMGSPPGELEVRAQSFAAQPLGIIAAPDHELAGVRSVLPIALAHREFNVREPGSGTRVAMERYFRDVSIEPPRILEVTGNEAIKQAVMAKMGLAFLSLHTAGAELQQQSLVALDVVGLPLLRSWFVVELSVTTLGDAAGALRNFILEHGRAAIELQFDPMGEPPPVAAAAALTGRA